MTVLAIFILSVVYQYFEGRTEGRTAVVNNLVNFAMRIPNGPYHAERLGEGLGIYGVQLIAYWLATDSIWWGVSLVAAGLMVGVPIYDRMIQDMQGRSWWTSPYPVKVDFWFIRWTYVTPRWQPALIPVGILILVQYLIIA